MARFLILTWDGAGNVVPFQAIVEQLVARGHSVSVWSHESNLAAYEAYGAEARAYPTAAPYDARQRFGSDEAEHARWVFANVFMSRTIADDALTAISAENPEAVVVDDMLLYAHAAVQSSGRPAAVLAHVPIANERARRRRNRLFESALGGVNRHRRSLGLAAVGTALEATETTGTFLVATAPTFDPPAPESPALQVGAIRPTTSPHPASPRPDRPLVVVSLSSGWMHQVELLQRVLDGCAELDAVVWATLGPSIGAHELDPPPNAELFASLPHDHVLPTASLLVTHAGHGTVMAGLAHGVPMLCVPLGRDQPANAARAHELGAALVLEATATAPELRAAAATVLEDDLMAERCRELATRVRAETRVDVALSAIEGLAG